MARRQDASTGQIIDDGRTPDSKINGREVLQLKVYSPYRLYFDEPAYSVTAVNRTGTFDVLPRHHDFISLLEPCELGIQSPHGQVPIKISGGVMHVHDNHVIIFLDI